VSLVLVAKVKSTMSHDGYVVVVVCTARDSKAIQALWKELQMLPCVQNKDNQGDRS
jgi:hypothetical protein